MRLFHHAVLDDELVRGKTDPLRGHLDQHAARFGGRVPERDAAQLDAGAAGRAALVARGRGIAHLHAHLLERDVELLGDDLRDGDVHALAHVHLAEIGGHAAVGKDGDPGVELVRCQGRLAARGGAGRHALAHRGGDRAGNGDADDERAGGFEKIAAGSRVHGRLLMPSPAPRA
jgi:hypothetical protein